MCDLIDHHEREMMLDLIGDPRPVPRMGRDGFAEPVSALATSAASFHHAGAGEGRQRAPDAVRAAMRAGLSAHGVIDDATADALMLVARVYVHSLWDHAVALAAEEGPVPLVGEEAWAEGDPAYAKRLGGLASTWAEPFVPLVGFDLDDLGAMVGLPRARLVPIPQRTEEP